MKKQSRKKKWRWVLIAVGSVTTLLLLSWPLTSTQQKPIEKKYQHTQSRTPNNNIDSSLKYEPSISLKTQENILDSNQIGSQQILRIKKTTQFRTIDSKLCIFLMTVSKSICEARSNSQIWIQPIIFLSNSTIIILKVAYRL
jgi:hypothetical protein